MDIVGTDLLSKYHIPKLRQNITLVAHLENTAKRLWNSSEEKILSYCEKKAEVRWLTTAGSNATAQFKQLDVVIIVFCLFVLSVPMANTS